MNQYGLIIVLENLDQMGFFANITKPFVCLAYAFFFTMLLCTPCTSLWENLEKGDKILFRSKLTQDGGKRQDSGIYGTHVATGKLSRMVESLIDSSTDRNRCFMVFAVTLKSFGKKYVFLNII